MTLLIVATIVPLALGILGFSFQRKKRFLETPIPLRIRDWRHHGERFTTIVLESADGRALPSWTPGSHIVIDVDAPRGKHRRAYSLLAGGDNFYEIAVAHQAHGKVSGQVLSHLQVGYVLHVQPPRGRFFRLRKSRHKQVTLIGGGIGIAPLISMAKEAWDRGYRVHLIHATRHANECIAQEYLPALTDADSRFRYTRVISRDAGAAHVIHGRLAPALLETLGLGEYSGDVYLCGSTAFVEDLGAQMRHLGCTGEIHQESFSGNHRDLPHDIRINGQRFKQGHAPTLLAACEENGVLPFAECRTGHCQNCRATLKSGRVEAVVSTKSGPPLPPGQILTCACIPVSDVEIEMNASAGAPGTTPSTQPVHWKPELARYKPCTDRSR